MSDQPTPGSGQGEGGAPGAEASQQQAAPTLQITAQYIKDLSFENPNAPASLTPGSPPPQVAVSVDVRSQPLGTEDNYEVVLHLRADAKSGDTQAFIVELAYAGTIRLANVKREQAAPLLLVEAPRLLFPFARAVIASATRDGGFPPLLIQPIDFVESVTQASRGDARSRGPTRAAKVLQLPTV